MSDSTRMPSPTAASQIDRLVEAIDRTGTPACVGLDPLPDRIPDRFHSSSVPETIERFCMEVLDSVAGVVPAVKPQSAHFERHGSVGVAALERVIRAADARGLFVVLDFKRSDIGSTASHYAASACATGAHACTVNPYLGASGITPFLEAGLLTYALVRTSNPDSDRLQSAELASGETVAQHVGALVREVGEDQVGTRGLSGLGAVVGATKSAADGQQLRERMPSTPFLVPGVGAQGGTAADVRALVRPGHQTPGEAGVLVNASRSVLYPDNGTVTDAAKTFADDLRRIVS